MDLIFLYGPPGVGKLTVGEALAARTGYRLLHNHLTIDLVTALFPFGSPPFRRLVTRFRLELLAEAAREGLPGVITSLVYAQGSDDAFVDATIAAVAPYDARFCPVLLTCEEPELLRRVGEESRARHGKLRDREFVSTLLANHALTAPIPQQPSLHLDNGSLAPDVVAARIAQHYGLPDATPDGL